MIKQILIAISLILLGMSKCFAIETDNPFVLQRMLNLGDSHKSQEPAPKQNSLTPVKSSDDYEDLMKSTTTNKNNSQERYMNNQKPSDYIAPQKFDYSQNVVSDVFGANLFTGAFAKQGATQFNPNYVVAIGDQIQLKVWGAFSFEDTLTVDPQGNIFIPHTGPIRVKGVRNQDLQKTVEDAVKRVFKNNVYGYASLASAQPVRILVTGYVNRPGLYGGTSMDSLLHFIDQSGGIDTERGSFLNILVKRGDQVRFKANLYDFLLNGSMPLIQLADGDVIFVSPRSNTVKVSGLADNAKRFEFNGRSQTIGELAYIAKPKANATHVRVTRNSGVVKNIEYFTIHEAMAINVENGDEVEFTADKKPGTITVRVEGEHMSAQEYVLPYGSKMGDLLKQIQYSDRSDKDNIQLFRTSVQQRQKQMLLTSLQSLEASALTARSGTSEEARLRADEANLILQWVERAKKVEPKGQVVIAKSENRDQLLLENGDLIKVPTKDGLVLVSGEVLFPNAIAYTEKMTIDDYVLKTGGYTQNADSARIVVARRDGSYAEAEGGKGFFRLLSKEPPIQAGDEILVLPKIDVKYRQIFKEMTTIMYQIAVSARVVFGL